MDVHSIIKSGGIERTIYVVRFCGGRMKITRIPEYLYKFVTNPGFRFSVLRSLGVYDNWDDERFLKKAFKVSMGKELNLDNPKTFNEKLQWLKLYNRKPEYTMMVDKYRVRDYISKQLGDEYLIPLLGVWDRPEEIDFSKLPNSFVLKCNHNSGLGMYICKDKSKLKEKDIRRIRKNLHKGLKQNYYLSGREWPYKEVPRKIICEQYMEDNPTQQLTDYKLMTFGGKVKCTFTCTGRGSAHDFKVTFYDTDWKKMSFERHYPSGPQLKKPASYDEMVALAEKLASHIPFARIDFYEIEGKPYFGEITLFPGSGMEEFTPEEWDSILGSWIKLPDNIGGGVYLNF